MMKTAVVTGASGFVGKALTEYLVQHGYQVHAVIREKKKLGKLFSSMNNVSITEASFDEYEILSDRIGQADIFFHLAWAGAYGAAVTDYELQVKNITASCKAIEQAVRLGCDKFVLAGTVAELEVIEHIDKNVCQPRGTCIYASAKLGAEMMCKTIALQKGIAFNAGLFANIFGPGDHSRRSTNIIINQMNHGIAPKLVKGDGLNDWLYVKDAVRLITAMGEKGVSNKTYYIGHTELKPLREIISAVRDILAPEMNLDFGTIPDTFLTNYSYITVNELFRDTGCKAEYSFNDAIRETAEWVRSMNMEI